jgi:uncharacterized protein YecT (DUF1311 family)
MTKRTVLLAWMAAAFISCAEQEPPSIAPPLDWPIRLEQPIRQLEEVLASTELQQQMNYTSTNIAFAYDAILRIRYDRYIALLPPGKRNTTIEEQRQWLEERRDKVDEAYKLYDGSSMASYVGSKAFIDVTKQRIVEYEVGISGLEQ